MDRRTVLVAGGVLAAGSLATACGGSAAGGSEKQLADVSEVPVGGGFINSEVAVVVTQPDAVEFRAFTAVCPHQGCLVNRVEANEIICPCHNSRFSAVDGAVISGPAPEGLAPAKVAVEGDAITLA